MPMSARLPRAKVVVKCDCGKKYRVPARRKARITCKACSQKIEIGSRRAEQLRDSVRRSILNEHGIDPDKAPRKTESKGIRAYTCTRCHASLTQDTVVYAAGEIVCAPCREAATVVDKKAERKAAVEKDAPILSAPDVEAAKRAAALYGLLFALGLGAPLRAVLGLSWWLTIAVALVVGVVGAWKIFRSRTA
jgi:hypothetical protein